MKSTFLIQFKIIYQYQWKYPCLIANLKFENIKRLLIVEAGKLPIS